ncbi:MAG: hypothetical protein ACJASU_002485 [Cognaticolwellia sp.]|jgi:hypothetical protein
MNKQYTALSYKLRDIFTSRGAKISIIYANKSLIRLGIEISLFLKTK